VTYAAAFSEGQQSLSSHCSKRADKELQSVGTVPAISDLAGTYKLSHTRVYTINMTEEDPHSEAIYGLEDKSLELWGLEGQGPATCY